MLIIENTNFSYFILFALTYILNATYVHLQKWLQCQVAIVVKGTDEMHLLTHEVNDLNWTRFTKKSYMLLISVDHIFFVS